MKAIKKSLCFALAVLSAAFTARAADPVAVWVGKDLNGTTQGGITLNLNGNTYGDGAITISSSKGVLLNNANANVCSVIIEYENFNTTANAKQTLFTLQKNGGEDNNIGVYWNTTAKLHGIYKNSSWDNGGPGDYTANAIPASGRLGFGYNKGGNGVTVYAGDVTVYDASGLKEGGSTYTGVSIGGYRGTATIGAASNMKITAIAFFTSKLSAADVAAYEFPEPEPEVEYETLTYDGFLTTTFVDTGWQFDLTKLAEYEITGTMSGGNIANKPAASTGYWVEGPDANGVMKFQMQVYQYNHATDHWLKAVEVELKQGDNGNIWIRGVRAGYVDGGLTDPKGSIKIPNWNATFVSSETGGGYGVNKVVVKVPVNPIEESAAEIKADQSWSDLDWDTKPTASDKAELTVSANATLTFDSTTQFKSLKLIGANNLTITGITSANVGLVSKITTASFTGKLTFEIDASAGLTADTALKNYIRAASGKVTFVFKSTVSNKGATLDYGTANLTDGKSLGSHIVFDGGTHTFQYRCEYAGLKFGANATAENPTIRVTNNATLTFAARNLCGWTSGNADANGIIRVDNGSKLNLNPTGGTLYWAQQFYLEPGAQLTYSDGANFRINGGTNYAPQIFVPSSDTDMTATPAKIIRSGNNDFCVNGQGTKGMAISVGANSKLIIESGIALDNTNCDIIKLGGGVLAVTGNIVNQNFIVNAGSVSLHGSITKLTLNENGALDIDNGTPTITGSLVTATEKQLKLAITSPVHGMSVITLPDAADKTGWTARVNGREAENELIAEGNTLKLKWKIPPTIELEADDVTIETADDWNGGVVTIDIGSLTEGDYVDDITYLLKFGDKTVTGSAANGIATFELSADDFTAGNIYRGTFELEYGTGNEPIVAAEVTVYAGEKTYGTKEGWINETTTSFKTTGSYNPETGASVGDDFIKFLHTADVVFTPTNSPADYVAKCDSTVTFEIFSGEEAIQDDDDTVAADLQAGVKIVDDGSGGVKFQFISGDEWIDGPAAALNTTYEVKISFHYAKEEGDTDSVTYAVKDLTQGPVVAERRANTAEKLEAIAFADGTQIASLTGTCQIEVAEPVEKETGLAPGADGKELKATDETAAKTEAKKIPVVVPSEVEGGLTEGLDDAAAEEAKAKYKENFMVVAQKNASGKFVAIVVPTADAETNAVKEVQRVSKGVLTEVTALAEGTEGTATVVNAVPGFFYGVAETNEVIHMQAAEPKKDEWKMAGASGKVELKVTKPANAKARFYKIICSPLPQPAK